MYEIIIETCFFFFLFATLFLPLLITWHDDPDSEYWLVIVFSFCFVFMVAFVFPNRAINIKKRNQRLYSTYCTNKVKKASLDYLCNDKYFEMSNEELCKLNCKDLK